MNRNTFNDKTDCFTLANGVKVPCIGYGTWQTPNGGVTEECVKTALELGYRHIDTAWVYGNEEEVGRGIKASGVDRKEIFLTSKHWVTERGYKKTLAAIDASLKNLGTDYMDLYLVHWPCVQKLTPDWAEVNADTWRGFEEAYKAGKLRAIGVSNYQKKHLDALFAMSTVKPMVNQIEFHPGYTQFDNVEYSRSLGMLVEAWSPLGSGAVLKNEQLVALATKYGKSVAELCVRFALQCGVLPLPKSTKPERIDANAKVFDFVISDEDMKAILDMPTVGFSTYLPEDAPADALT